MHNVKPEKAFLGSGWAFPVTLDETGAIEMVAYEADIQQAIHIILGVNPGERLMRPDFGAGLNAFVFEPINVTTLTLLQNRVHEALIDWEPRIDVTEVKAVAEDAALGKVAIDIHYRVRATNTHANLVYPFYLQEGPAQ